MICINQWHGKNASMYHGDSVEMVPQLPERSVDLMIYSPPFASLYTYSDSPRDMGNCTDDDTFMEQYRHLLPSLLRALRPGRNCVVHCADLPSFLWKHGHVGLRDFSGELIRAHVDAGFGYHSRITIWKDPVTEMQRTNAHGLLYKTFRTDSARCRAGNPDYLLVFRRPGDGDDEAIPVTHDPESFPVTTWQEWASPVWMTVEQSNTLNVAQARDDRDEKHMCPLQLDVIERAVKLWSNPGDVVLSPFGGVGSEGVGALTYGRKYVGMELKESYWRTAVANLSEADNPRQVTLFGGGA